MVRLLIHLGVVLLAILSPICAIEITDVFTLKAGNTNGGCDGRAQVLDNYLEEILFGISAAQKAIERRNDPNPVGQQIRTALTTWFGIQFPGERGLKLVTDNINYIGDFFNGQLTSIPARSTYLYCDSTWLTQKATGDAAQDFQGNVIITNNRAVPISDVAAFKSAVQNGLTPWFSGGNTPINGYYFTSAQGGGRYCSNEGYFGLTSTLRTLKQSKPGANPSLTRGNMINNVILCPFSFDTATRPASYAAGRTAITAGSSLFNFNPRSSTLLHEAFHVVFGTNFNEGDEGGAKEFYTLAECMNLGTTNGPSARKNPENYVFFISAIFYLFGETLEGEAGGNLNYWDFTNGPDMARGPIVRP